MSGLIYFPIQQVNPQERRNILVVFCADDYPALGGLGLLREIVDDFVQKYLRPDEIILVLRKGADAAALNSIQQRLSDQTLRLDQNCLRRVYEFDGDGTFCDAISKERLADDFVELIRHQGLTHLMRVHSAIVESDGTFHFEVPGGRKTKIFIHTANAFTRRAEALFAAVWLLKYYKEGIKTVWVDTSGILNIAWALVHWLTKFEIITESPDIRSFRSYAGLAEVSFGIPGEDLVIISASQTGSLAKAVIERKVPSQSVVTMTSLRESYDDNVLADIAVSERNPNGWMLPQAGSFIGSRSMRIIGEWFRTAIGGTQSITLVADRSDEKLRWQTTRCIAQHGILSVNRQPAGGVKIRAVHFDIVNAIRDAKAKQTLLSIISKEIPASVTLIVHDGQLEFVRLAQQQLPMWQVSSENTVELGQLEAKLEGMPAGAPQTVLVISGAASRGAWLLNTSRALRRLPPGSYVVYLVGAVTADSNERLSRLKSNLVYPAGYRVHIVYPMVFDPDPIIESFEIERKLLTAVTEAVEGDVAYSNALDFCQNRIDILGNLTAGLEGDVFLPNSAGGRLNLRRNFSFWDSDYTEGQVSQGSVLATMAMVLQRSREGGVGVPLLINTEHQHTVLSPECFTRFNDGVVQASLLRAARPEELNYKNAAELSRDVAGLIKKFYEDRSKANGEAIAEFILAIATDRLQLCDDDKNAVLAALQVEDSILGALKTYMSVSTTGL